MKNRKPLSPEQREKARAYAKKRWAMTTPEQRAERNRLRKDWDRQWRERNLIKVRKSALAWVYRNEEKAKASNLAYRKSPRGKRLIRDRHILNRYGLTPDSFNAMWKAQNYSCAVCGKTDIPDRFIHIDHCHASPTMKIRGLCCNLCNTGLGMFRDRIDILQLAITYLERHK